MNAFLTMLLLCTISMSIITLIYAASIPLLSKRYAPKWRYIIWLVIAFFWMMPFRPLVELPILPTETPDRPLIPVQTFTDFSSVNDETEISTVMPETIANTPQISVVTLAFKIWLTGVLVMTIYHVLRHRRFLKIVDRWSEKVYKPDILNLLDTLKCEQDIKARIEYKVCSCISTPMMIGFFHPVILMPSIALSDHALVLILRHELTHYKRHDLWYKAMILVATVLHWFNPLVYFMARSTSLQCEISCDAHVLENKDLQTRKQYGETIIAVVRGGNAYKTSLSTNFYGGKNGMKNRIMSMLDRKHKKAGVAILCVVLSGVLLTGAILVSSKNQEELVLNSAFTETEYAKLHALRFDGYKDMSVLEFQEKVWKIIDTAEYMELLERFYLDDQLNKIKDSNEDAAFIFYELTPLVSEKWQSRYFSDSIVIAYSNAESAVLEYTCSMSILDANQLTVKMYSDARKGVMESLKSFVKNHETSELQDATNMIQLIDSEVDELINQFSSDALAVEVEYNYKPLVIYDNNQEVAYGIKENERDYPYATLQDYRTLLAYKTDGYRNRKLSDFNEDVLEWSNENYERMERITTDIAQSDFAVSLKEDELSFIIVSFGLSEMENGIKIFNENMGNSERLPTFGGNTFLEKEKNYNSGLVYCSLYYQMNYTIPDDTVLTVGERDRSVSGVISDINRFWDEVSIEDLIRMNQDEMVSILSEIAKKYTNEQIRIQFEPTNETFGFEQLDDRNTRK